MKSNLALGTIHLTLSTLISMLGGYIINIWLGRYLGPEAYGIYGIVISLVTIINHTQVSGLPFAVSKYVASNIETADAVYKTGFYLQIISNITVACLFFFLSGTIAVMLKDPQLTQYLQVASIIFPIYGFFAFLTGFYNGKHLFKKQANMQNIYAVTKVITILIFTPFFHLYGVIYGFIISPLLSLIVGFHLPKSKLSFPYKKLIYFSIPLIGIAIFSNLLLSIDILFVKALLHSNKAPGYYTAGQNISRIPFFALSALSVVLLPSISKTVSQNLEFKTQSLISKSLRIVLLICLPLVTLMSATSNALVKLIYSAKYLPAADSLSILLFGIGFLTIFTVQSNVFSGAGKPQIPLIISIIGVIITSILCLMLIPKFALNGAATATTIGSFVSMVLASFVIYKKFNTLVSLKSIINILLACVIVYFLAKVINFPILFLPFLYLILFAIYIVVLILLKEITKDDIQLAQSLLPVWVLKKIKV